jgi:ferric-dicitrate binding protein FerR (iron transport regulator)
MKADDLSARVDTEIAAPLRDVNPGVDELHRARLVSAIDAALDSEDRARAERRRATATGGRARRRWAIVAVGAVAVVALVIVARSPRQRAQAPAPPASPSAVVAPAPLLRPYQQPGHDVAAAPTTSLVALRGERARATLGMRVRLTLVGPGRVSVLTSPRDGDIELALEGGRLLVDYDGRAGGTLRVRSPGAVTTVVGTLFAVEVTPSGSRVAVAHGRVRTEDSAGRVAQVSTGSSWTSAGGETTPIPEELAAALAEHQADWSRGTAAPERSDGAERAERPALPATRPRPHTDLDALYARAEAAMRERSLGEARRTLATIASRDPHGRLGETALLDLARLALADGDRAEARRLLARLPNLPRDPALAETAAHLRCRAQQSDSDCD